MATIAQYQFISSAGQRDTFDVLHFSGTESVSQPFSFDITLRSKFANLDLERYLNANSIFALTMSQHARVIQGMLHEFEALGQLNDYTIYRAVLVPDFWRLKLFYTNEVYLDLTIPEIIETVLADAGFTSLDYRMDLQRKYRKWPYKCQYEETHFDFICRMLEREGVYYYFEYDTVERADDNEQPKIDTSAKTRLVFCDNANFHADMLRPEVIFSAQAGEDSLHRQDCITTLKGSFKPLPHRVILRDYNDETPSLDIVGTAIVDDNGRGDINIFGQNIVDDKEGNELAAIRADDLKANARLLRGEGSVTRMAPGLQFTLSRHFRDEFNKRLFIVSLQHEGFDPRFYHDTETQQRLKGRSYNNQFTLLNARQQFRPAQLTICPQIKGTIHGVIDSATDGKYAEIDNEGRYKVILPFDRQTRGEGKASHWLRLMQPMGGENEGMHFPLRKGARVLLTFIDGDPDRPVIAGCVPNSEQPSVVNAANQTNSMIKTASGNKIEIEDKEGSNRIKLESPHQNSYFHLGAPNHEGSGIVMATEGLIRTEVSGGERSAVSTANSDDLEFRFFKKNTSGAGTVIMSLREEISGNYLIDLSQGDSYNWSAGYEYNFGGRSAFSFGCSYAETHAKYVEANGKSGIDDGTVGIAPGAAIEAFTIPTAMTGAVRWDWQNHAVEKAWTDTYSYNCGNNYAWSDVRDFSFGYSYAESHKDADAAGLPSHGHGINYRSWEHDFYQDVTGASAVGRHITVVAALSSIEKSFGDGYEYSKGNGLAVSVGNSEEHSWGSSYSYQYGGRSEEHVYQGNGVTLISEEWSEGGTGETRHYNANGVLDSYERTDSYGSLVFSTTLITKIPTLKMEMDFSQLDTTIKTGFSSTTTLETTLNAFFNEFKFGATGMSNKIDLSVTGLNTEITNEKCEVEFPGLKTKLEWYAAELEAKSQTELATKMICILQQQINLSQTSVNLTNSQVRLASSLITLLM